MIDLSWVTFKEHSHSTYHQALGEITDRLLKESVVKRTFDNITIVLIAFQNFEKVYQEKFEPIGTKGA